jgi:hypothetical protein
MFPPLVAVFALTLAAAPASPSKPPASAAPPVPADTMRVPETPQYWRTRAEKTNYRQTADYDETLRYCRQLEAGSNWVKYTTYGQSGQGRDLPLLIVSKDRLFTPEAALASGKPVVFMENGIHSGEIEGKDACLALVRDLAVLKKYPQILDNVILLVTPIFSVDAHERSSRWNRINQNGPETMGWRTTPVGLNLNRDFLKAEAPEMKALLSGIYTRWWPHLLIDNHTTDGADYQHDLTYSVNAGPAVPAPIRNWMENAISGRVIDRVRAMGHLPAPYLSFRSWSDPSSGIAGGDSPPRFSTGYPPLHGRAAILTETHMLKPYPTRVRATYDFMVAILEEVATRPRELLDAVAASEAEVIARGREPPPGRRSMILTSVSTDSADTFAYRGLVTEFPSSEVIGSRVARYTSTPWDTTIRWFRFMRPGLVVTQPAGYLVPREWTIVREKLDLHAVRYQRLARAWRDTVELTRIDEWRASNDLVEGHHPVTVLHAHTERQLRAFRPGDLWVPLDQRSALVAAHLLEAQAPDGLLYWNAFDTVLQFKEYGEDYVVEPIAREMLARDPALKKEFENRLKSDSAFAASPFQRADFFYRRSPWADPDQNLLPVARALRRPPAEVLGTP